MVPGRVSLRALLTMISNPMPTPISSLFVGRTMQPPASGTGSRA